MTIAAFARDRGVDEKAVRKAITAGRLSARVVGPSSTGRRRVITDPAAARLEWDANASRLSSTAPAADGRGTLLDASRIAVLERGRRLKMDNDRREGGLVELATITREAFESSRIIRETLLNLPVRLAAELAGETDPDRVFQRLDAAIREALASTSDRLEAAGE